MSTPADPSSSPPSRWSGPATDPGRVDAVESLYRGTPGRSGLRAWEPSLRPPEGTVDHSWLYRPEPAPVTPVPVTPMPGTLDAGVATTASGALVLNPGAQLWATPTRAAGRRWPTFLLLTGALVGAALLTWFATGTPVL